MEQQQLRDSSKSKNTTSGPDLNQSEKQSIEYYDAVPGDFTRQENSGQTAPTKASELTPDTTNPTNLTPKSPKTCPKTGLPRRGMSSDLKQ